MTLFLVRHAHAGSRSGWSGDDDFDRPLSDKGRRQAAHFARAVADRPIRRLWSSPAVRCIQTLDPLTSSLGLPVEIASELTEGASADGAIQLLLAHVGHVGHVGHDYVFCSHGDLIPKVIRRLSAAGMRTDDPNIAAKGSWWALETEGDTVVSGRYFPHGTD